MSAIFLDVRTVKAQIAAMRDCYPEMETDARLLEDSLAGQTDFREVIARLIRFEREADTFACAIKAQEESLADRRARYVKQQQIYRRMIHTLMDAGGQASLRLPEATVSIARGRPGCVVTDAEALPDELVKIERTPKKADIIKALMAGASVPGAELSNNPPHLTIRI